MDAKTREALEEIAKTLEEWRPDEAVMSLWVVHGPRMMRVHMREAARRIREVALDAPAEAPLRGEVHAAPHVRPYRADPAGRWEVNATVLSPTREDAERVAAALRAVLARLT